MKFLATHQRSSLCVVLVLLISLALLTPVYAQGTDVTQITSPTEGQALAGLVTITGSANHPDFARYELAYGPDPNPNDAWQPFAEGKQPVNNGVLGTWNTSVVADGQYALRLRVVRKDSNYSEYFVRGLKVSNSAPIGTPTANPLAPTFPAEAATLPAEGTFQPQITVTVDQPPTSIPEPTSVNATLRPTKNANQTGTSLADSLNFSQWGTACLGGVALVVGLFILVGVIQGARWSVKQIRRRQRRP